MAYKGDIYLTRVKICGLRRLEDAYMMNEGLPDFIGFILTPSRRRVTLQQAAAISEALSPSIKRVGVFAAEPPAEIAEAARNLALDGIQLHMDTTQTFADDLDRELGSRFLGCRPFIWQRLPISPAAMSADDISAGLVSFPDLGRFEGVLLDTRKDGKDGGTGSTFPWAPARDYLIKNHIDSSRIIVAGGLDETNAAAAVSFFKPFAVDVSSSVETDGYKDREKVIRFIETARKVQGC